VARHSHATRATVVLRGENGSVRLEINDNGVGFDAAQERAPTHQGLTNMAERAARHGGNLSIQTSVGAGTRIIVTMDGTDGPSDQPRLTAASDQEAR
jgi:signal transduction histidine kinase